MQSPAKSAGSSCSQPRSAAPRAAGRARGRAGPFACLVACANLTPRKGWNRSYGPVVPHDTFPADRSLCHESGSWNKIKADFTYDHEKETGVALTGVHARAQYLFCHNDRGPVKQSADKGCRGCHEDNHRGRLGCNCGDSHNDETWRPRAMIAQHSRTRFPLVGAHAAADCSRCHPRINRGGHSALSCANCHTVPAATPAYSCTHCHDHDRASTDRDHREVQGYQYLSTACYNCHRR